MNDLLLFKKICYWTRKFITTTAKALHSFTLSWTGHLFLFPHPSQCPCYYPVWVGTRYDGRTVRTEWRIGSSPCLTKYHVMMTYWGSGGISPRILNPALDGGMWSASLPSRYTHGTHWIGGWVGPRAGLDATEKRKIPAPADNGTPAVQPVA
jgi:hypothetical protein